MRVRRHLTVLFSTAALLVACGGGGGDAVAPPTGDGGGGGGGGNGTLVNTYNDTRLPGRLTLSDSGAPPRTFDLQTGGHVAAPLVANHAYRPSVNPALALRVGPAGAGGARELAVVNTSDWSVRGTPVTLSGNFSAPKLSPDGNFILTFWTDFADVTGHVLAIFDLRTGQAVKYTSRLDDDTIVASPAAWLPNGNYVYLEGRTLYESTPVAGSPDTVKAVLTGLPSNDATDPNLYRPTFVDLSVSPDGKLVAFTWRNFRLGSPDTHVWIAGVDGSGLHQATAVANPNDGSSYGFAAPIWSPDSRWIATSLDTIGGNIVLPPNVSYPDLGAMTALTGCVNANVYVLPVTADKAAPSWPVLDTRYAVKVRNPAGTGGAWVSSCGSRLWTP